MYELDKGGIFMSNENRKTLEVYEKTAHIYLSNSVEHDNMDPIKAQKKKEALEELIRISFAELPKGAKVFEIGSADGANAKYIDSLGFDVMASDTVDTFVEATKMQGVNTIKFNALEDDFPEKYFAVFCWRVFVHFTKDDALKLIKKVYDNLEKNGIFIFNAINRVSKGVDNEWVDFEGEYHMGVERYYNYFLKEDLDDMIAQTDFKVQDFHTEGGKEKNKWLVYVLKK